MQPAKKTAPARAAAAGAVAAAKSPPAKPAAPAAKPAPAVRKPAPESPVETATVAPTAAPERKPKIEPGRKAAPKSAEKAQGPGRKVTNLDEIKLPSGYRPGANEEYMGPNHLAYFRQKLLNWRHELIQESQETLEHLRTETRDVGDEAERASRESDNILELRTRDRYRKLLGKIDQALKRIEDGSYGYCEETGEEIGLGRLEARPIATLTVDAQERREMLQRQFRDDH
jgi:DnaK suppressor protein